MKKIIFAFTIVLALNLNANAQQKKAIASKDDKKPEAIAQNINTADQKAEKEAYEVAQFLELKDTQKADFQRLLAMKHKKLQDTQLSDAQKAEFLRIVEMKIKASLDGGQIEKLEQNQELWKKLIGKN